MDAELLINRSLGETRVALLEDGATREIIIERDHDRSLVGSIYRGRITRVLPGMQAAFIEVGEERAAFLYVDDIVVPGAEDEEEEEEEVTESVSAEPAEDHECADVEESQNDALEAATGESVLEGPAVESDPIRKPPKVKVPIRELITEGQEITVQVVKAPLGTKGARVTNYVTVPGRAVVYMPTMSRIGISRKITDETERKRLKGIIQELRVKGEGGFIARTACVGLSKEEIERDMAFVRSVWEEIQERNQQSPAPALLQPDLDLVLRTARDLFTDNIQRLVIDDRQEAERIQRLLKRCAPHLVERVHLHDGPDTLFAQHAVEPAIDRALQRSVSLKSGASIVVDEAEALTAIDINTGSFVGSKDLEATILETNLEAAEEIANQIRLRNLGGIIIVDFIDMQAPESKTKVHEAFVAALGRDRARTHVLPMTDFGLIELTRKRVRPSLGAMLAEDCPYCEGRGWIRGRATLCQDILRAVERSARLHPEGTLMVSAMSDVASLLSQPGSGLRDLEIRLARSVVVQARHDLHQEVYQVTLRR